MIYVLQSIFTVDKTHKKWVLQKAGRLLRKFRSDLVKYFIKDANGEIIPTPPTSYEGLITQEHWNSFLETRTTMKFKKMSDTNRQSANTLDYRYCHGRLPMSQLEQQIVSLK